MVALPLLWDWMQILTLVFGGCCSNALTLEQITSHYPFAGSLITFFQFLLVSLYGLPKFIRLTPYPHFKRTRIPLTRYLVHVVLFYLINLLNNAAFAFKVPMPVHIIFRSGGLVVSICMGWLITGKRYRPSQILSVICVTAGVILTTLSASKPPSTMVSPGNSVDMQSFVIGILMLSVALILSGFLGMVQDWSYARYVNNHIKETSLASGGQPVFESEPWQESMFYLHFLSMPMFIFLRKDLSKQLKILNHSPPQTWLSGPENSIISSVPSAYVPLLLNTITQVICVAGVNRLTSKVSSLTVTLVLVVRKAVSLLISVSLFSATHEQGDNPHAMMMWAGAFFVFAGTIWYSIAAGTQPKQKQD